MAIFRGAKENFSQCERRYGGGGESKKFHKNHHHQLTHI